MQRFLIPTEQPHTPNHTGTGIRLTMGLAFVLVTLLLSLIQACNRGNAWKGREDFQLPDNPDAVFRILLESSVGEMDPRFALSAYGAKISNLIFDSLVTVDNPQSEPELILALNYQQLDETTYLFNLRDDVVFHDGHPLDAHDVVYTFTSVLSPHLGSPLSGMFQKLEKIEAVTPHQVLFKLNKPHSPFITDLTLGIVPSHILEETGGLFQDEQLIGSGPYKLAGRRGEDTIVLQRNPAYFGAVPRMEYVTIKTIRDENSRVLALLGGSGDMIQNAISPLLIPVLEAKPSLKVITRPSVAYSYMILNLRDPALVNPLVRKAIAHAIDREGIIKSKLGGRATLATGLLAPGHWAHEPDVIQYDYNPAKARQYLDEAGYPIDPLTGARFKLTLKTSTDRLRRSIATVIAHNLKQVGIDLEVQAYEFSTFFHDIRSGNFQLATLQWPSVQEPDMYNWIFHSQMIPTEENRGMGANRGAYINPTVDRLIEQGRSIQEREQRQKVYSQIQQILADELPYISLWHDHNVAVIRDNIADYTILPNARFGTIVNVWKDNKLKVESRK